MVLRTVGGARTGEDVEDLRSWLRQLEGGPHVDEVVVLACAAHGDEPSTWTYVEADALAGVARRRCLACAQVVAVLDSADRWTDPPMHACSGCAGSIVEVAAGLAVPDGEHVEWVALAARCVECGRLAGLTDLVLPGVPVAEVVARL
jgi:hypothetical protein